MSAEFVFRRSMAVVAVLSSAAVLGSAVGTADASGGMGPLASGSSASFRVIAAPLPPNAETFGGGDYRDGTLSSIACTAVTSCTAVGYYKTKQNVQTGLIEDLSNGRGAVREAPAPPNAASPLVSQGGLGPQLLKVACVGGSCTADGAYTDSHSYTQYYVEAGMKTAVELRFPPDAALSDSPVVEHLACARAGSCFVMGYYFDAKRVAHPVIETVTGSAATLSEVPLPADANPAASASLGPATCDSDVCVAVGGYTDRGGKAQDLMEILSGGSWRAVEASLPDGLSDGGFSEVTCVGRTCFAVGDAADTSGHFHAIIGHFSGNSWTATEAPVPANAGADGGTPAILDSVTCVAPQSCVAAGTYNDDSESVKGLIETLSGHTWSATEVRGPVNASGVGINGIACGGPGSCVAISTPYLVIQHGDDWVSEMAPGATAPSSVACPAPGACVIAGTQMSAEGYDPVILTQR